jgi:hypothetical protein
MAQDDLARALREIYRNGNESMRAALRESNEALVALGYDRIFYSDLAVD